MCPLYLGPAVHSHKVSSVSPVPEVSPVGRLSKSSRSPRTSQSRSAARLGGPGRWRLTPDLGTFRLPNLVLEFLPTSGAVRSTYFGMPVSLRLETESGEASITFHSGLWWVSDSEVDVEDCRTTLLMVLLPLSKDRYWDINHCFLFSRLLKPTFDGSTPAPRTKRVD